MIVLWLAVAVISAGVAGVDFSETDLLLEPVQPDVMLWPGELETYDRGLYRHWIDSDGDGENTRREVLNEESDEPVGTFIDRGGKRRLRGHWTCPYTKEEFSDARELDIDHLVPLKEAHVSGGWRWDAETRKRYANDLSDPDHLVAVKARANRQKGAKDPARWLPPQDSCNYAIAWIRTKQRWDLSYDSEELDVLLEAIGSCSPRYQ